MPTLRVQDQSPEVQAMAMDWAVCEALMGGTRAMRAASAAYLPKWPGEEDQTYQARLLCATLLPAYRRTVSVMSGKPFSKALTLGDDVPETIRGYCDDIDLQGRNLHAFAADAFQRTIAYGLAGILVDYPKAPPPTTEAGVTTKADEEKAGVRPYFVLIRHSQMLGWKSATIGGAMQLTQLRIAETHEQEDGEYGVACVKRVRVLTPGRYEVWQEPLDAEAKRKGDYLLIEQGPTTLKAIPFVPCYGFREGFMIGRPPLLDLAWLNIKHWQSQSDQDNINHVARVPILVASGIDDPNWKLVIGAGVATKLPPSVTLAYCEHSGAAIAAGRESLQDLEAQMIQTGAELLVKKPGDRSATEAANDADGNKSDLQRIAETFADCLDAALQLMADWIGEKEGGHVALFSDFGASSLGQASGQLVLSMQQGGLITKPTAIREMQRRGELDAGIAPEEELAEVEAEGPALGHMVDPNADPEADPNADPSGDPADPTVVPPPPKPGSPGAAEPEPSAEPFHVKHPEPQQAQPAFDVDAFAAAFGRVLAEAIASMPATVVNVPQQAAPTINTTVNVPEQQPSVVNVAPASVTVTTPDITVNAPDINIAPAAVTVNMPDQPASVVNVAQPAITVNTPAVSVTPEITVNPPAISVAAPVVNVAPAEVNVTVERLGGVQFTTDENGDVTGAVPT